MIGDYFMDRNMILLAVYNALIGGASIQNLVNIVREYFGNPIAVCNCNLETIAYSQESNIDDKVWASVISEDEYTHFEFENLGNKVGLVNKVNSSNNPVIIQNDIFDRRYMNCAIFENSRVLGNMVLIEYYRAFNDNDYYLMDEFCHVLAYYLINKDFKYVQDPNAELIMVRLLNGDYVSPMSVFRYLFQPKESAGYVVVVMDIPGKRILHRSLSLELRMLILEYPEEKAAIYNETLVLLFQTDMHHGSVNINWDKLKRISDKMDLICGISKPFNDIMELRFFYEQAKNAIIYGEHFKKKNQCYFYQDISLLHLLNIANQSSGSLIQFCDPALIAILEYDEIYNTKWFRTLYVYLNFNCDISKAADALNINRNSMYYRINKIQEIIGPGFRNHNFLFQMKLSISILYFLKGEAFYEIYDIPEEFRMESLFS
jgi:hypothetical protein